LEDGLWCEARCGEIDVRKRRFRNAEDDEPAHRIAERDEDDERPEQAGDLGGQKDDPRNQPSVNRKIEKERHELGRDEDPGLTGNAPRLGPESECSIAEELKRRACDESWDPGCHGGDTRHTDARCKHDEIDGRGTASDDDRTCEPVGSIEE